MKQILISATLSLFVSLAAFALPTAIDVCDTAVGEQQEVTAAYLSETSSGTCGENLTWTLSEDGTLTISGDGAMTSDFSGNTDIKGVIIGDGVTAVCDYAFNDCTEIETVSIGSGVISIGEYAFNDCNSLCEITIPDNVTTIGIEAFGACDVLKKVTIGNGVAVLPYRSFGWLDVLEEITIGSGITTIEQEALKNTDNLIKINYIGTQEEWQNVEIQDGNDVLLNSSINYFPDGIPEEIRVQAISLNTSASGILKGSSITLTATVYPEDAANKNYTWKSSDENVATVNNGVVTAVKKGEATITVTTEDGGYEAYCTVTVNYGPAGENSTWDLHEDGTMVISGSGDVTTSFSGCSDITKLVVEGNVTSLPVSAFYNCTKLVTVEIQAPIKSIGKNAFSKCSSLLYINLPQTINDIGEAAFNECGNLRSITIPNGVKTIRKKTFYKCSKLTEIDLGTGVEVIESEAFYDSALKALSIPDSVISIGKNAFYHSPIKHVSFGNRLKTIGAYAFYDCSKLTSVVLPDSVISLGEWAFCDCDVLKTVVLGQGITSIPQYCFRGTSLTSVTLDKYLTNVGYDAFDNVAHVYYYGTDVSWSHITIDNSYSYNNNFINAPRTYLTDDDRVKPMSITFDVTNATMKQGNKLTINATVLPENLANKELVWFSSDASVAHVSDGVVTAQNPGFAIITAATVDGSLKATCSVTVKRPSEITEKKAYFVLSDASVRKGNEFEVEIMLHNDFEINSIALRDFTYDNSRFELVRFEEGELLENAYFKDFNMEKGSLSVGYEESAVYNGVIGKMIFKAKTDAAEGESEFSANCIVKNNNESISSSVVISKLTVLSQLLGDINLDDSVDIRDAILLFEHSMMPDVYPIEYLGSLDFTKDDVLDFYDALLLFNYSMMPDSYPIA